MKILHCTTYDERGGAAMAANRIHKALLSVGIESSMGVQTKQSPDPKVHVLPNKLQRASARFSNAVISPYLVYRGGRCEAPFSSALRPSTIYQNINNFCADITHLHWITDSFLPLFALSKLKGPVVWTLHDTWAFTGGCHILRSCTAYLTHCKRCPTLQSHNTLDLSYLNFSAKKYTYSSIYPTIVCPSKYMQSLAAQSSLLKNYSIKHIPNAIDTDIFKPLEKKMVRSLLNLPIDSKLILFGADGEHSNPNKGFDLLKKTLDCLNFPSNTQVSCLILGAAENTALHFPFPSHYLGNIRDQQLIALIYAAADIFICPSREENLPNMVMEALACGTPVAAFEIGGIPEMVTHKKNGWLSPAFDTLHLAKGVEFLLTFPHVEKMSDLARAQVLEHYSYDVVAECYKNVYEDTLNQDNT